MSKLALENQLFGISLFFRPVIAIGCLAFVGILALGAETASAQPPRGKKKTGTASVRPVQRDSSRGRVSRDPVSIKHREELLTFVKEHHPELERLLQTLEKNRPEKYRMAMRGLSQSVDRIKAIENEPVRYQAALRNWKLKSRIDLLAARIALKDDPELRAELRELISQSAEMRSKQLQMESRRARQRVRRIEQQLARLNDNREREVDRQFELVLKKTRNSLGIAKAKKNGGRRGKKPKRKDTADPKKDPGGE